MKKSLNIFTFVKKTTNASDARGVSPIATSDPNFIDSWDPLSEEEEDFNVSDKSLKNEDENYCTASEGTVKKVMSVTYQ